MTLNEYQKLAAFTAIYPGRGTIGGMVYCTLKLNGEAGEVAKKIGKILRDEGGMIRLERTEDLTKELGDVLWYIAACAMELGISLETVADMNLQKLESRKARGTLSGSGDNR